MSHVMVLATKKNGRWSGGVRIEGTAPVCECGLEATLLVAPVESMAGREDGDEITEVIALCDVCVGERVDRVTRQ